MDATLTGFIYQLFIPDAMIILKMYNSLMHALLNLSVENIYKK